MKVYTKCLKVLLETKIYLCLDVNFFYIITNILFVDNLF